MHTICLIYFPVFYCKSKNEFPPLCMCSARASYVCVLCVQISSRLRCKLLAYVLFSAFALQFGPVAEAQQEGVL